jgi:hypothetical protein
VFIHDLIRYISSYPFAQILDEETQNPELIQKAVSGMKQLNEADLLMLLGLINRLLDTNNKSKGT